jgi:hypothetical protein
MSSFKLQPGRAAIVATAVMGALLTLSGPAFADAGIQSPNEHAACVAQAWVPANTDPANQPGALGAFIRAFAQTGEWGEVIRQQGCKL